MSNRKVAFAAAAALIAASMAAPAFAAGEDTAAELQALKARIAQLEAAQNKVDGALAQSRAVDAAIADANAKQQFLLADGLVNGWDNGFKIGSADGSYLLQPYVEAQFRNVTNATDGADDGDGDDGDDWDVQNGFEFRRLKVGVKGNAFSKDFTYNFRLSANRNGGDTVFDLAYVQYQFATDWAVRMGQYKLNWTHEESTSSTRQLAAERSLLNAALGGGQTNYVQGVALVYGSKANPFRADLQFTDGDDSSNTNYTDNGQNFGVALRTEYKVFGKWDAYGDFTARKTDEDLLVIGGGADWVQMGDVDTLRLTVDGQFENTTGLGLYLAGVYNVVDADESLDNDAWGGLAQVGYLLPTAQEYEVFGRYSYLSFEEDVAGEDSFHEITVGVNRYFYGHNAKATVDVGYLPSGAPDAASGLGITGSTEDQFYVRAQFQLVL